VKRLGILEKDFEQKVTKITKMNRGWTRINADLEGDETQKRDDAKAQKGESPPEELGVWK
jgi:hypothetical protein